MDGISGDRAYYAQRAAEEEQLALSASDQEAAAAHRRMQRVYLERASVGARLTDVSDEPAAG